MAKDTTVFVHRKTEALNSNNDGQREEQFQASNQVEHIMTFSVGGMEETLVGWFILIMMAVHLVKAIVMELAELVKQLKEYRRAYNARQNNRSEHSVIE